MAAKIKCACGAVELTRARTKYGLRRWRRFIIYMKRGFCIEHRDDVCLYVTRKTNHFPGLHGKLRNDGDYMVKPAPFTIEPVPMCR